MRRLAIIVLMVVALAGCFHEPRVLVLASTTSTVDSGILDVLNAEFQRLNPRITVRTIGVGTGEALAMGERRDADVLLVHDRRREDAFMAAGHGALRKDVMYNDFVLLGPRDDPAGVRGAASLNEAMQRLLVSPLFVSRGDNSGTHSRERSLWQQAGLTPGGANYIETGQGMGATLRIASDRRGYTLSDRGTFLATAALDLIVVFEGDPALLNPYGVITVNGARNPRDARAYAEFLVSPAAQNIIANFGKDRFGQPLFFRHPNVGR